MRFAYPSYTLGAYYERDQHYQATRSFRRDKILCNTDLFDAWLAETEAAKFWISTFNELKNREMQDCCIACVDGPEDLPETIKGEFPEPQVQLCVVHKLRNSFKYMLWIDRKAVAVDLRVVYSAAKRDEAEQALDKFSEIWESKYPDVSSSWRTDWKHVLNQFVIPLGERVPT